MLQKAAKMRLFAFKTSQLRFPSASPPLLLRSAKFCYVCIGETHRGWRIIHAWSYFHFSKY